MPFHDAFEAESQLNTLVHRGRWDQALTAIDEWLVVEPWRLELLLRKAHLMRVLHRYEQGLATVREYRAKKPAAVDAVFVEAECLLDLDRTTEAMRLMEGLPAAQRGTAQAQYYLGRALLGQHEILAGLHSLWNAYLREPGFNRALLEWSNAALRYYGKWWVCRQLEALLMRKRDDPTIAVSVGLALTTVDSRHGQHLLRRAVERYTDIKPLPSRRLRQKSIAPADGAGGAMGAADAYRIVNEQLLVGHSQPGIDAYYKAVSADPSWMPVLASLVAEVLVDELVRPEEARLLLEDALRREPTDYRLHLSYTKVFLQLGFGEEALSSANCALALAPETEKAIALVQRAGAHLLLRQRDMALDDLRNAISRMPEARQLIAQDPRFRVMARNRLFRGMMATEKIASPTLWQQIRQWLVGG